MSKVNWEKLPDCEHTRRTDKWIIANHDETPIRAEKPLFWVAKDGRKFPFFSVREGSAGSQNRLPTDGFPYTIEYEPLKPRAWM